MSEHYDPMETTELDALMKVKKMLEKENHGIDGIIICVRYDPLSDEKKHGATYFCGGGMNVLTALGLLEFTKLEAFQTMLENQKDDD